MSRSIKPNEIGQAISKELQLYSESVNEGIAGQTKASMDELVKKTKASAPTGKRGSFKKNITADYSNLKGNTKIGRDLSATWYVKAPDHRLTHLLVHGHATKDGGRTRPNPFLQDAVNSVIPDYEQKIEEVIKNGG